jgi:hypothetical protein
MYPFLMVVYLLLQTHIIIHARPNNTIYTGFILSKSCPMHAIKAYEEVEVCSAHS